MRLGGGLWKNAGHLLSYAALTNDLGRARTSGKRHLKIFGFPERAVMPGLVIMRRASGQDRGPIKCR